MAERRVQSGQQRVPNAQPFRVTSATVAEPYTPTTEQVRDGYRFDPEDEYRDPINAASNAREAGRAFDRWLARVRAEAAAEALEEAAEAIGPWTLASETSTVLRERAAELREKAGQ